METLRRVCDLQKQYGKTESQLETMVEGFAWVLTDFTMDRIIWAIGEYIRAKSDIPAPADIHLILNPPKPVWKPDWAYYVALKRKIAVELYFPYSDEREYLRRCEEFSRNKLRDYDEVTSSDEQLGRNLALATGDVQQTIALLGHQTDE